MTKISFPVGNYRIKKEVFLAPLRRVYIFISTVLYIFILSGSLAATPTFTPTVTQTFTVTATPTFWDNQTGGPCGNGYRFGDTAAESNNSDSSASSIFRMTSTKFNFWEDSMVHGFWVNVAIAGTAQAVMGLYSDGGTSPLTKICTTTAHTVVVGWNYFQLSSPVQVAAGNYWITYQSSAVGTSFYLNTAGGTTWATTGTVVFNTWPASFPAGSGSAWIQNFTAAYCPVNRYFGNRQAYRSAVQTQAFNSSSVTADMRFQQHGNDAVTAVQVYVSARSGTQPVYLAGIQADDGTGRPTGTFLGSGTIPTAGTGWVSTAAFSAPVIDGQIYHMIIQFSSGTASGPKNTTFALGTEGSDMEWPSDQAPDPGSSVSVMLTTTWNDEPWNPLFALNYSSGAYKGRVYDSTSSYNINGAGTVPATDDAVASQIFNPMGSNWYVDHLAAFVQASSASPGGNLNYAVVDQGSGVTITSGTFITNGSAPITPSWVEVPLSTVINMYQGHTYRLAFLAPSIAAAGYTMPGLSTTGTGPAFDAAGTGQTYGDAAAFSASSANGGGTYTNNLPADLSFLFRQGTPLPTPTSTPTGTQTFTVTPSFTRTNTPSPTMSATFTRTPCIHIEPHCHAEPDRRGACAWRYFRGHGPGAFYFQQPQQFPLVQVHAKRNEDRE